MLLRLPALLNLLWMLLPLRVSENCWLQKLRDELLTHWDRC
jgi:hypothetical protein